MIPNDATNIECVKNGSCGPVSDALWNIKYHTDVICVIDDVKPVHRKFLIVIYFLPGLLYLWIGDHTHSLKDLHFAIRSFEDTFVSTLIGDINSNSSDIAKWLSHKINLPALVSCNVSLNSSASLIDLNEKVLKLLNDNGFLQ